MSNELLAYQSVQLYRLGDFYEAYGEQAKLVAETLDLHLTSRPIDDERVDMVGFPQHTLERYVEILQKNNIIVSFPEGQYSTKETPVVETENDEVEEVIELDENIQKAHNDFKESNPDYIICIRCDDHYEIYGEDANTAVNLLSTSLEQRAVAGFTETTIDMTALYPAYNTESYIGTLKENGHNVILVDVQDGQYVEIDRFASDNKVQSIIAEMSDDEKERHIGWIELKLDYGEYNFSNEDFAIYNALIETQPQIEAPEVEAAEEQPIDFSQYVGMEVNVDDRKFIVDSVNTEFDSVSLKDVTFENGTGFPIFRRENTQWLQYYINQQEAQKQVQEPTQEASDVLKPELPTPKAKENLSVIYPEIKSERNNFVITNDELGYGTAGEKYAANVKAIRTLKTLEAERRLATPEEQEILSNYVGWGGLADCFDEKHSKYQELKSLLTESEYEQARATTLNAHYTSPTVVKAMYKALENMGFKEGNILEPSCGTGNFMGLLPESMKESKMYGIEIDDITGRIAKQLYPRNSISIEGYEDAVLPDSFFDVAIGNVPFGNYKLADKKYDKHKFFIHDYFFAKTLDKVRPGGIVAFITSMGTMDKQNSSVRKYIAQRAELLGAIRLPNNAFLKNAGTQVTADILFLQKRDRMTDIMPEWVNLGTLENGLTVNQYFVDNPDMILGEMTEESSQYGQSITCKPYEEAELSEQLEDAIQNIHAQITEYEFDDISNDEDLTLPADPNVKNFSYTLVDGDIYFRENSIMKKVELNATAENRIKGLIGIRDAVREVIDYQTEDFPDFYIQKKQEKLNQVYDEFTKKYGLINSRGNSMAFSEDSSYFLLCSLEVLDENGELERKADIFTKRTIGARKEITKVDTASEALAVSIGEKAKIDMEFMTELTGKTEQELYEDLKGVIFLNPMHGYGNAFEEKYLTADEYLSGNVREKLVIAQKTAEVNPEDFTVNVEALKQVQPKDLSAAEISVKLGSTWIPDKYIQQFTYELLDTPIYARREIKVTYYKPTAEWNVSRKSFDNTNVKAKNTYGTHRANAYKIIEETLNQRDVRIFDYVENENGNKTPVLNAKETAIAQQKQETIKQAFLDWVWKDPTRREELVSLYNTKFNSTRPREYDGSHITFNGINPEIELRQHQKNAVARVMYGGNTLIGHEVGAGKTWTMVAAAMESKRLGLCNKSLFVVPNHLTEQWASEFLQLYPAANILVATKKDCETKNRKKFCGRIATGDYDAIIIGHSQFEKIPMST
ncbi:MAG: DEAD/DEAH box helicase family protein, partial [Clostridia bacterium]|nr:DEAD/DEAH box helicase family protein [Clostridia bacterium]